MYVSIEGNEKLEMSIYVFMDGNEKLEGKDMLSYSDDTSEKLLIVDVKAPAKGTLSAFSKEPASEDFKGSSF
jgi:hypothetical protein